MSRNKYHSKKIVVDNVTFDSLREATRYMELKQLFKAGKIGEPTLQPKFPMNTIDGRPILIKSKGYPNGRQATYFADFRYFDIETSRWVIEDVKGIDTPVSKLKRAIVEAQYLIEVKLL